MSMHRADSSRSLLQNFFYVAVGGLVLSILFGSLLPIYTDELIWKYQRRAAIDGVDLIYNDSCGLNTLARPPWFIMPLRYFSAVTNEVLATPILVRATGVACALVWAILFWQLIRQAETDVDRRHRIGALTFALLGLGVLPLLGVMSRPEQPLILATLLIVLIGLARWPSFGAASAAWLKTLLIVALAIVAQSYHMKGVPYTLVAITVLAVGVSGKGALLPRLLGIGLLLGSSLAAASYWIDRFKCPDDPVLAAMFARENIFSGYLHLHGPVESFRQLARGTNPLAYVDLAAPAELPMSFWLPGGRVSNAVHTAFSVVLRLSWLVALALAFVGLLRFAVQQRWSAFRDPRFAIAIALAIVVAAWGAVQLNRNVYEASHILPAMAMFIVLCLSLPSGPHDRLSACTRILGFAVVPIALVSQITVAFAYFKPLKNAASAPGYILNQPNSISLTGYGQIKKDIAAAMTASGMPTDRRLNRVLIDDLTYMALQDTYRPLHELGIFGMWNGSIKDPVAYLISRNSDGIVIGCHHLPQAIRDASAQSGQICAVSRGNLARLAQRP